MMGQQQVPRDAEAGGETTPERRSQILEVLRGAKNCTHTVTFAPQEKHKDFCISHHWMADDFVQISFQIATSSFYKVFAESPSILFFRKRRQHDSR